MTDLIGVNKEIAILYKKMAKLKQSSMLPMEYTNTYEHYRVRLSDLLMVRDHLENK